MTARSFSYHEERDGTILMDGKLVVCSFWLTLALATLPAWASGPAVTPWAAFGPDGGDARRLAPDPHDPSHLYLGTTNGWIYESHTAGDSWSRLAQVGKRDDLVLDSILVDPSNSKHVVVGAKVIDHPDGGIYFSYDGGATWTNQAEMRGQSVLSLTQSASDPRTLVAGTLQGVYRSTDGGMHWGLMSPPGSKEIHNVQSVAIDPRDPAIIYAGTWHLPWKTSDGGEHWENFGAKQGIIDDSDVFSIIIDPMKPNTVFASACSGIYKSETAGAKFTKISGIPNTARRTRRLLQDPSHLGTVFAGTTEGLYRSDDAGKTWARITGPEVIVNDIEVDFADPRRVLIATDRGGVLASDDGGDSFHASNTGFSARQITALKRDARRADTLFVGVVNDKNWGGVFESDNGGQNWTQRSDGLEGRDVFALGQAPDGTMIAGTSHGLFRLDTAAETWTRVVAAPGSFTPREPVQAILARPAVPAGATPTAETSSNLTPVATSDAPLKPQKKAVKLTPAQVKAKQAAAKRAAVLPAAANHPPAKKVKAPVAATDATLFDGSVNSIVTSGNTVLAATSAGLLTSQDDGISWAATGPADSWEWRFLAAAKGYVVAATLRTVLLSSDGGARWARMKLPEILTQISTVAVEPTGEVWVGGREGVFVSSDAGNTWAIPKNVNLNSISNIFYDEASNRVMITTTANSSYVFTVLLPGKIMNWTDTGWNLRFARPMGDHLVAATLFDGIVVQPRAAGPGKPQGVGEAAVTSKPVAGTTVKQD
jgi:photosystem II stability/assembly factor-like uncharacterized protein